MKKESQSYRTEHHSARAGLAAAMRKHNLSSRAVKLIIGLLGECDDSGIFHKPLDYALDWSQQGADTGRAALKELLRSGLVCKHPLLPRAFLVDPACWFDGSKRQLARHIREYERGRHGLPREVSPLH